MPDHPSTEWAEELADIGRRRAAGFAMGGAAALDKLKTQGRFNAREQVQALIDAGTLRELGGLAGACSYGADGGLEIFTPSNHVMGTAALDGRKTVVIADDASIRGGALDAAVNEKWVYADRLAYEQRLPLVRLVDTGGGSIRSLDQIGASYIPGFHMLPRVALLWTVPVASIAVGACAGLGAIRVGLSHFSVMIRGKSQVFAGGPPVVRQALGIDVDKETLGGHEVHKASGAVIEAAEDPVARRLELEAHYHHISSPLRTASRFGVVDIIEPATTRPVLCDWVEDAWRLAKSRLGPKGRPMR